MPRKQDLDPPTSLHLMLPQTIRTRLDLLLFSELERRVPFGKYQEFFLARLQEFFDWKRLDLSGYDFAPGSVVAGPKAVIEALEQRLKVERQA